MMQQLPSCASFVMMRLLPFRASLSMQLLPSGASLRPLLPSAATLIAFQPSFEGPRPWGREDGTLVWGR